MRARHERTGPWPQRRCELDRCGGAERL